MKIKTLLAASLLVPGLALAAVNQHSGSSTHTHRTVPGFYVKAEAGLSKPSLNTATKDINDDGQVITSKVSEPFKDTFVGGLGVGYTVNEFFRTDLMFGYRRLQSKGNSDKVRLYSGLLNVYFDGQNTTMFTPYVMGGLGIAHDHFKGANIKSKTRFAWNAGAGVYAKVAEQVNIDLGYRYVGVRLGKIDGTQSSIGANEFLAGLVFKF